MQSSNRFFDDAARLAGSAMGTLSGIRRELEAIAQQQFDRMISGLDLVRREEFDTVREMAANARAEQERLSARVAELEAALAARPKAAAKPKKAAAKKPAAKKTAARKPAAKPKAKPTTKSDA